jgi:hypothetical protein
LKQLFGFGGSQDRSRLVEQEDPRFPRERLYDLQSLLECHRESSGTLVGIEGKAQTFTQEARAFPQTGRHHGPSGGERHIFCHGQRRHGGKVLMHHANPELAGVPGRGQSACVASDPHFTPVALHQAVRHMHQSGLAGTVLPEESVDFTLIEREIGPAECLHGAEALRDSN